MSAGHKSRWYDRVVTTVEVEPSHGAMIPWRVATVVLSFAMLCVAGLGLFTDVEINAYLVPVLILASLTLSHLWERWMQNRKG